MNEDIKTNGTEQTLPPALESCIRACQAKLAEEIVVLDLRGITSFADYFREVPQPSCAGYGRQNPQKGN